MRKPPHKASSQVSTPRELPVGVITGLGGGVVFLVFLVRARQWEFFR